MTDSEFDELILNTEAHRKAVWQDLEARYPDTVKLSVTLTLPGKSPVVMDADIPECLLHHPDLIKDPIDARLMVIRTAIQANVRQYMGWEARVHAENT